MQAKKEKTKQTIINTAIRLISLHGYNAITTAAIAKEAELSEAIIFKYFKNKENLLREIINIAITQIFEHISLVPLLKNVEFSKDYPPREFIKSILTERFSFFEKNHELIKVLLAEIQYSEKLLLLAQETLFPKVYEAFGVVREIIMAKMLIPESHADAILRIITGILTSFTVQRHLLHVDLAQDKVATEIEIILNIIEESINKYIGKSADSDFKGERG
jgi:AcrR family transcriptional regulator